MACAIVAATRLPAPQRHFRRLVNRVLRSLHFRPASVIVSLAFLTDQAVRALNVRYRGQPATTDVLSFPLSTPRRSSRWPARAGTIELGDVVIALPQARRQARAYGTTLLQELDLLVVHGLLHLVGYDHERPQDRQRMVRRERQILGASLVHRAHSL